jgi:hypothetical protein
MFLATFPGDPGDDREDAFLALCWQGRGEFVAMFGFIAAAMLVVFIVIGEFGPATTRRRLEAIAA